MKNKLLKKIGITNLSLLSLFSPIIIINKTQELLNNKGTTILTYKFGDTNGPELTGIIENGHHHHPSGPPPMDKKLNPITAGTDKNADDFYWDMDQLKGTVYNTQTAAHQNNEHNFSASENYDIGPLINRAYQNAANKDKTISYFTISWEYTIKVNISYDSLCQKFDFSSTDKFILPDNTSNNNRGERLDTYKSSHWFGGNPWTNGHGLCGYASSGLKSGSNIVGLELSADIYTYFTHNWHHSYSVNDWEFQDGEGLFTLTPVCE